MSRFEASSCHARRLALMASDHLPLVANLRVGFDQ